MQPLTPQNSAPTEVGAPLFSTGMGRGFHTWAAIILVAIAVLVGIVAKSITGLTLGFLLTAGAIGLLGEVGVLLSTGEVRARCGEHAKANRFLVIRKEDSPARFYFYVVTYLLLGIFSMLAALVFFVSLLLNHAK